MSSNSISTIVITLLLTTVMLSCTCAPTSAQAIQSPEFRGIWVDSWHSGFLGPEETSTLVNTAANANYNAIIAEVRKAGDAYYDSAYEPRATNILYEGYDPLADLIAKAHAKGIEVHAWIVTYRIWSTGWGAPPANHMWALHPEWVDTSASGNTASSGSARFDPGIPGVQQYVCDIVKDIATKYPELDGINFDYIRYDGNIWGYNPLVVQRFTQEYGFVPPTDSVLNTWATWGDFRRRQVTDLVRKCYAELIHINPDIKVSVDTIGWMGADPNTNWTSTRAYTDALQDHKGWMQSHIIDMNILMNYKREYNAEQQADYRKWCNFMALNKNSRHSIIGPASYLNSISDGIIQLDYARGLGADGVCTYCYSSTNKDGDPSSLFFSQTKANQFLLPVPTPDMPWKSRPTLGILFGQVTDPTRLNDLIYQNWVYKALVTINGPVTKTMFTDATGTYVFNDLPPGEYSITVSATGYKSVFATDFVVAGEATKRNFQVYTANSYSTGEALDLPDGASALLTDQVVTSPTGAIANSVFVESSDRSAGIKVIFSAPVPTLEKGNKVDLIGVMATESGDRVLTQASIYHEETSTELEPLGIANRDMLRGPTTSCMLLEVTGIVQEIGSGWFNLEDGSATIKVWCPNKAVPAVGEAVKVAGINCMVNTGVQVERVLHVRSQADIDTNPTIYTATAPTGIAISAYTMVGVPCTPLDPSPDTSFGFTSSDRLYRYDGTAYVGYNPIQPVDFGGLTRGEGYFLYAATPRNISFQAISSEDGADMRINLPSRGWSMISHPFATSLPCNQVLITNGQRTQTLRGASMAGWIAPYIFSWNPANGAYYTIYVGSSTQTLSPWRGYWIRTNTTNLALVIPN